MLAAGHRLTNPEGFRAASRRGQRAGARTVVVHLLLPEERQVVGMPESPTPESVAPESPPSCTTAGHGSRVGLVVSKAVGNAVLRNRVKRRLRHAVRPRLDALGEDSLLVVRALPAAAAASYQELVADLDRCLERVGVPGARPGEHPTEAR